MDHHDVCRLFFFLFTDTAPTEIYTLSLHDALPIFERGQQLVGVEHGLARLGIRLQVGHRRLGSVHRVPRTMALGTGGDRKSTRLNSSHVEISYAVFCLKKKKKKNTDYT